MKDIFFEALMKAAGFNDPVAHGAVIRRKTHFANMSGPKDSASRRLAAGAFDTRYNRLSALASGGRKPIVRDAMAGRARSWTIKTPFPK